MNPIDQLRDIHGLDTVSWWPLATGWWILISLLLIILLILALTYRNKRQRKTDWRRAALTEWKMLQPGTIPNRTQVQQLSILLRRIAIQRYGRLTCAGLTGKHWLEWLTQHDPHRFDWTQKGRILIELPYLSPDAPMDTDQVHTLYQVVRSWIK